MMCVSLKQFVRSQNECIFVLFSHWAQITMSWLIKSDVRFRFNTRSYGKKKFCANNKLIRWLFITNPGCMKDINKLFQILQWWTLSWLSKSFVKVLRWCHQNKLRTKSIETTDLSTQTNKIANYLEGEGHGMKNKPSLQWNRYETSAKKRQKEILKRDNVKFNLCDSILRRIQIAIVVTLSHPQG
jgi:hypothetical protein